MIHRILGYGAGLLVLGLLLPAPGRAQFDRNGAYLALGGTVGFYTELEEEIEDQLAALGYLLPVEVEDPVGLDARAGFRSHPHFSFEVELEWLPEAEFEFSGVGSGLTAESWMFSANALAYILRGRIQPFVLVGSGIMVSELAQGGLDDSAEAYALRFGGGVDLYVTENIVANLGVGYVLPVGSLSSFDYVSLRWGLGYRF